MQPSGVSVSTLTGVKVNRSLADWEWVGLQSVDEKAIPENFLESPAETKVSLTPGRHRIVAKSVFNKEFGGAGPFEVLVNLDVDLKPDRNYQLCSEVKGESIEVWVKDVATNEVVSGRKSEPYRPQKMRQLYIPSVEDQRRTH